MPSQARSVDAAEDAYERLSQSIMRGELAPGQRLVEVDLVETLGVSRAVVRVVLTRMAHAGLIEKEMNRGARVRKVGDDEAIEITQVRAVLEGLAARQAAARASDADVAALRKILSEMKGLVRKHDLIGYSDGNRRLHAKIIEMSGHTTAQRLIANLRAQPVRFQYRTILVPGRAKDSLAEHTAIVDAIAAQDGDAAETAMRAHLGHVTENLLRTKGRTSDEGLVFGQL